MTSSPPHVHPHRDHAVVKLVYAVASWDECVSLVGAAGADATAVLDRAERELSGGGIRCVRVRGPASGGLGPRELMAQVVGRADPGALTDAELQAGFAALTEPGAGHDRVILLVSEAHGLLPSAVRLVQLACRTSPKLLVVLAGQPGLAAVLAPDEFAYLRQRITRRLELPDPAAASPPASPVAAAPAAAALAAPASAPSPPPVPSARRLVGPRTLVKLGVAASLAFAIWTTRWGNPHTPPTTAAPAGASSPDGPAAVVRAGPGTVVGGASTSQSDALVVWTTRQDGPPAPAAGLQPDDRAAARTGVEAPAESVPTARLQAAEPVAPRADPLPDEAAPLATADAPDAPEFKPAGQEQPEPVRDLAGASPPPLPEQAAELATDTPPEKVMPPPKPDAAPAVATLDAPPAETPAVPAGTADDSVASAEPPAPAMQGERVAGDPAEDAERVAARAPEPIVEPAPLPPAPDPVADANPLIPPPEPPPSRARTVAVTTLTPPEAARRARGGAERIVTPAAVPPARLADERRCRDIVLKAQLGEDPSDADKQFLRGGCRVK